MTTLLILLFAYLIGSIPSSLLISKSKFKIDIRNYGSGNAGATNVFRVLGLKWGVIVLICDMFKGFIAVKLAYLQTEFGNTELELINFQILLGILAVIGHIYPVFAQFRGGKGVATIFGLVLAISPFTALSCVGVFILVLYITRFVSLSSIIASIAFPIFILAIFNVENSMYRVFAIAVALIVILTHQKNIGRIVKGVETKIPILKYRDKRKISNKIH